MARRTADEWTFLADFEGNLLTQPVHPVRLKAAKIRIRDKYASTLPELLHLIHACDTSTWSLALQTKVQQLTTLATTSEKWTPAKDPTERTPMEHCILMNEPEITAPYQEQEVIDQLQWQRGPWHSGNKSDLIELTCYST